MTREPRMVAWPWQILGSRTMRSRCSSVIGQGYDVADDRRCRYLGAQRHGSGSATCAAGAGASRAGCAPLGRQASACVEHALTELTWQLVKVSNDAVGDCGRALIRS